MAHKIIFKSIYFDLLEGKWLNIFIEQFYYSFTCIYCKLQIIMQL